MFVLFKIYVWHQKGKLILLACAVAVTLCLYALVDFVEKAMDGQLAIREMGAIPSFTIYLKRSVPDQRLKEIIQVLRRDLSILQLRRGYRFSNKLSFQWDKGGQEVNTTLDVTRIGWDLSERIELVVKGSNGTSVVHCMAMHPVNGFLIRENDANRLGEKIFVVTAHITTWKMFTMDLRLPAVMRKGTVKVSGVSCLAYSFPKPTHYPLSEEQREEYRLLRSRYYSRISRCLSLPLGENIWNTLHADSKQNLFRLYDSWRAPAAGIPSFQLWQDICGASYQKYSRYKRFVIEERYNNRKLRYGLEFWGYCFTRYKIGFNGYFIMCNYDWLMRQLGISERMYNFVEIEVPFSQATEFYLKRLDSALTKSGLSPNDFDIRPWWDLANKSSVAFLMKVKKNLIWFKYIVIVLSAFASYQIFNRFADVILSTWETLGLIGAKARHLTGISMVHIFIYTCLGASAAYGFCTVLDQRIVEPLTFMTFFEASESAGLRQTLLGGWQVLLGIIAIHIASLLLRKRG